MDINLARDMIRAGFRCGRELEALLSALKTTCSESEYKGHAKAIARAVHEIHNATVDKATASHPELETELEQNIAKYGRYL